MANHAYGLFELAAIHLSQQPPELDAGPPGRRRPGRPRRGSGRAPRRGRARRCTTPWPRSAWPSSRSASAGRRRGPDGDAPAHLSVGRRRADGRARRSAGASSGRDGARPRSRPPCPAATSEDDPGADLDVRRPVGDGRAVEAGSCGRRRRAPTPRPRGVVELGDHPDPRGPEAAGARGSRSVRPQWTILDRGSSMMSVAPRSLRAGMRMFTSDLGTTVSTA